MTTTQKFPPQESGGGGGGGGKATLERVEAVSKRLEAVQTVLENSLGSGGRDFDVALLLSEVRKKAEESSLHQHSQDMSKAVHNVQRRLLEELVTLYFFLFT